ncbi:MAG: cell division protein SepF [Eubacteriales bacterium]|nr:cell division protein SepF [Eubacteriales bacterium]
MGILDRFLDAIKLNDDYDDDEFLDDEMLDEEDDDFLDDEPLDKPKKKFFEKFGKKKSTDDEFDEFDDLEEAPVKTTPKAAIPTASKGVSRSSKEPSRTAPPVSPKIMPMRSSRRSSQTQNMEVCVIKPASMEDTREIADTLLDNSTVILNLEGIDVELAQRIIDFASGACYSLNGSLLKVSSYIFVLGPYNVDIIGDMQNILGGSVPSVRAGY